MNKFEGVIFTEYRDIEAKYIRAGVKGHYKFKNALEVIQVLGYDIRAIKGWNKLSPEDQKLAEYLICKYISGYGLETRETLKPPISIKREPGRFKVIFKGESFSYLYDIGTVG